MTLGSEWTKGEATRRVQLLPEMEWKEIDEPGTYLLIDSGHLVRIPEEALGKTAPVVSISSGDGARVAKLSDDPEEPLWSVRRIAQEGRYFINF